MKKQFLHEEHNRNDRGKKPEYRREMREGGRSSAASIPLERLLSKAEARQQVELETELLENLAAGWLIVGGIRGKISREALRFELKKPVVQKMRGWQFFYGRYVTKRDWDLQKFAKTNQLSPTDPGTQELFGTLRASVERDMKRIAASMFPHYRRGPGIRVSVSMKWDTEDLECWNVEA